MGPGASSYFVSWGVKGDPSRSIVLIIKVGLLRDSWMTLKPVGRKVGP